MKRTVFFLFIVSVFTVPMTQAADLAPGAVRTLAAAEIFAHSGRSIQKKYDQLCGPVWSQAVKLSAAERITYLLSADEKLNQKLGAKERISCRGNKANLIGESGHSGSIRNGVVHRVNMMSQGIRISVFPQSGRVSFLHRGRRIEYTFDPSILTKNRVFSVNVPELSRAGFATLSRDHSPGLMPTSQQKLILDRVYWYIAEQETAVNLFDFYRDLLLHPQTSSIQIMSLYKKALEFLKASPGRQLF